MCRSKEQEAFPAAWAHRYYPTPFSLNAYWPDSHGVIVALARPPFTADALFSNHPCDKVPTCPGPPSLDPHTHIPGRTLSLASISSDLDHRIDAVQPQRSSFSVIVLALFLSSLRGIVLIYSYGLGGLRRPGF